MENEVLGSKKLDKSGHEAKLTPEEREAIQKVMDDVSQAEKKLQKEDPIYAKVIELYEGHITGDINRSPKSYFYDLVEWYASGTYTTKIRCLELILRLLQPGRWQRSYKLTTRFKKTVKAHPKKTGLHIPESQPPSGIGIVAFRLKQLKQRVRKTATPSQHQSSKVAEETESIASQRQAEVKEHRSATNQEIIEWVKSALETETDQGILTVFFLYMKTHGQQLSDEGELAAFHYHLLKVNHTYAKLQAFERLQMSWFSSGYRPQV